MANPWFRMYAEFATDAKVQSMPEAMQRRLMMLFCLRCSDVTVTLSDEELAFQLRISDEELAATKTLFVKKGFIDDAWEVLNWDKRQFASDSSAERTAAYRARKKAEQESSKTSQKRHSDALDTDTDKKQNIKPSAAAKPLDPDFEAAWSAYPPRSGASKSDSLKAWKARIKGGESANEILAGVKRYAAYVKARATEDSFIKQPATFFGPGNHFKSDWTVAEARGSPMSGNSQLGAAGQATAAAAKKWLEASNAGE